MAIDATTAAGVAEVNRSGLSHRFFEALGWESSRIEAIDRRGVGTYRVGHVERPYLIATPDEDYSRTASAGYTAEAHLAVRWSETSIQLLDPQRWQDFPGDTPLLTASLDQRSELANVIALMTAAASTSSRLRHFKEAVSPQKGKPLLRERLADALAAFRTRAFDDALLKEDDPREADTQILRTFHQLLFIRYYEDRHGALGPTLAEIRDEGGATEAEVLIGEYRALMDSALFEAECVPLSRFSNRAVRELLQALTEPWQALRLDFSVASNELAGHLYQAYLERTPIADRESRLFPQTAHFDSRSEKGAYYTPRALAEWLCKRCLGEWLSENRPTRPAEVRVLDPACGSGAFLVAMYRELLAYFQSRQERDLTPEERVKILQESIFGVDKDSTSIELARLQLLEESDLPNRRLPDLSDNLQVGDSLLSPPGFDNKKGAVNWDRILVDGGAFDVILMNPPFLSQSGLAKIYGASTRRELRDRFPRTQSWGRDASLMFVELSEQLLSEGGRIGVILPRHVALSGKGGSEFRKEHSPSLLSVIDFRDEKLFPGVATYVAAIVLGDRSRTQQTNVRMAYVTEPSDGMDNGWSMSSRTESFGVRRQQIAKSGWNPKWIRATEVLTNEMGELPRLAEISDLRIGQGTQVGTVDLQFDHTRDVRSRAGLLEVDGFELSKARTPWILKSEHIRPFALLPSNRRVFLPFEDRKGFGKLTVDEQRFLQQRGGMPRNPQPGAIDSLMGPKVLLPGFSREPCAAVDPHGGKVVTKGTGGGLFVASDSAKWTLEGVAGLLNSSLFQWLLASNGIPKKSGWIEILLSSIGDLPWPDLSVRTWGLLHDAYLGAAHALEQDDPLERLHGFRHERRNLDAVVFDALEIGVGVQQAIAEELFRVA